jgi:lambda repressor-like predicted transcriptional regulator
VHPERIKAEIRIRYGSIDAFERLKKLPRHSVNDVLRGRTVRRAADAIASELGKKASEIWPGRYREPDSESKMSDDTMTTPRRRRLSVGAR